MKKLFLSLLAFMSLMASAQEKFEMLLWNPEAKDVKLDVKDLTRDPGITVYRPAKPNGIAIIMCPGGGYSHQAINHEGHDMASWFNSQGITYAVLKYRLPQGDPMLPLSDAEQAVRILRSHAGEWNIDPAKIGIMGASAGGHLASMLSTHYSDSLSRPDFQVLLYPVITMDPSFTHGGSRTNLLGKEISPELEEKYSNEKQVTSSTPQAFIVLSSDDRAVPPANSLSYYSALIANKVPTTMHIYPIGGHGWGFRDSFPYKREWTGELEKWLREQVLKK